ncbi:MAG TPA: hypothetical protein VFF21_08180, partial [Flavobacteriaceae bacterium]|nr:hypothetical protein [Flavobacteriaceae bacterium]
STAGSNLSIAIGMDSKVTDHQSTALGYNTNANGHSSVALGSGASAGGLGSTALGRETSASGQYSTAIGYGATVSAPNTIRIGNNDAQIGIGTSAPSSSAVLDIQSTNKGILIPRISLSSSTDQSNVWNPVESLLIYNTNTVADVTPGFYYWQGNSWKALSGGGATGGTAPSQRAFGEVFVNSDFTVTLSQYDEQNNIGNGTSGLCNGATCSSNGIQTPSSSGAYRLTLIVTYSKTTPDSNNNLIEFHFVKNNTSIANTSIQADFNDDLKRRTVTISKILDLQAYQSYYWGIGKSLSGSPQVKIHRDQTSFILEKL